MCCSRFFVGVLACNVFSFRFKNYLDYSAPIPETVKEPVCSCQFLFSMNSYDHLVGVAERNKLVNSSENGLKNPIPEAKDLPAFGHRISLALEKVCVLLSLPICGMNVRMPENND